MNYYTVELNAAAGDFWFVKDFRDGSGQEIDARVFTECRRYDGAPVSAPLPLGEPGKFTLGSFDCPIVEAGVGRSCAALENSVQLVSLRVGSLDSHVILNSTRSVSCIDETRSEFELFDEDSARPELAGEYHVFYVLRLDPRRVPPDAQMFRLAEYTEALVVSEPMKRLLEDVGANDGITFEAVT